MQLGLAQNIQWPENTDQPSQIRNAVEQVLLAERLGFDSAYFVEHHWTRHGILPSTLALLCYVAACTSRIRLGSAVMVLPFHNPARLVEDASMLDILSEGRLELGVGRGFQWAEFNGFNMPLEESTERFDEALDFIIRAWTEPDRFSFKGKFHSYNDISVEPKAVQQPHPPIWMAAGSPASADKAGALGLNILLGSGLPLGRVSECVQAYRSALESNGYSFNPSRVALTRLAHIAESRELAWQEMLPYLNWYRSYGSKVTPAPGFEGTHHRAPLVPNLEDPVGGVEGDPGYLFCTPKECVEYIQRVDQTGVGHVLFQGNLGGMPQELVEHSINLVATEVLPQLATTAK